MRRSMLLLFVLLMVFAPAALAATVRGKIVQANGSAYANVPVTLRTDSRAATSTYSDRDGMFRFANVPPGAYVIEVKTANETRSFRVQIRNVAYEDLAPIRVK